MNRCGHMLGVALATGLLTCSPGPAPEIVKIGNGLAGEFSGRVVDERGNPLAGARVKAGAISTTSNADGYWQLAFSGDQQLPGTVTFFRRGYAPYTEVNLTRSGLHRQTMMQSALAMKTIDVSRGETLSIDEDLDGSAEIKLTFPANFLTGVETIDVTISRIDAAAPLALQRFPGQFISQRGGDSESRALTRSLGALNVSFHQGNTLLETVQLAAPASLELSLGQQAELDLSEGQVIDLSWLDTSTGAWNREASGIVVIQNGIVVLQTDVEHFTWWNVERPLDEQGCVTVELESSAPASRLLMQQFELVASGVDYLAAATPTTFNNARASAWGWRGHNVNLAYRYRGAGAQGATFALGDVSTTQLTGVDCKLLQAPFGLNAGVVEGFVLDARKQPVTNTVVSIPELGLQTTPNAQTGFYSFANVPWTASGIPLTVRASPTPAYRIGALGVTASSAQTRADLVAGVHPRPPWFVAQSLSNSRPQSGDPISFSVTVEDDQSGLTLSTVPTAGEVLDWQATELDDGSTFQLTVTGTWASEVTAAAAELRLIVRDASNQESTLVLEASWLERMP